MTISRPFISHLFRVDFCSVIGKLSSVDPLILSQQVTEISQFDLKPDEGGILRISFRQDSSGQVMRELSEFLNSMKDDQDCHIVIKQHDGYDETKLRIKFFNLKGYFSYSPLNYGISNDHIVGLIVHYQNWEVL